MTAFLQGISQFVPEIQPYQPDLNFFSNMLQTKQYQYDQGYNRVNSIYAGLLNSPVLRNESAERRDQFFKDIEQKIQKISTMDLSLEQNVNAAAKVFQPLIEDKDINFDMGMTRIYQREMQKGERLKNTTDPKKLEELGMWWDGGGRALNYWAQDFAKSSSEDMYKMPRPEYVPYFNVARLASEQLDKMKFPLGFEPYMSPDGRYIIQGKGGPAVMAPLYNHLLNIYGNDPRIAKVAQTEAYLQRKDFIAQNAGAMGEQAAETQYLNNILNQVNEQAKSFENQASSEARVAKASNKVVADALVKGDMFDPNRALAEIMGISEEQANVNEGAAQFHSETLKITNPEVLQASDFASLRNRADLAVARDLLSSRLYSTARDYAELNKEIKIEADPYAKAAFDNALDRSNMLLGAQIDEAKLRLANELDISKMQYEYYLKDYYGIGTGEGKGSGSGKGNNGVDQRNPNSQDGWKLGDEFTVTQGGEGTDGEQLTSTSVKGIVENEVSAYQNLTAPIMQNYATTLDKLYEVAIGQNPDEALVARQAINKAFGSYLKPGQGEAMLKADGTKYASWFNFYKKQADLSKISFSLDPSKDEKGVYNLSDLEKNVSNLKAALTDKGLYAILNSKLNMNDVYAGLDQSDLKLGILRTVYENQAYNNNLVAKRTLQAMEPLTLLAPSRLDAERGADGKFYAKYSDVDPNVERDILVETDRIVNERYAALKRENPKGDSGDLWDDAQEYGQQYYTNKMLNYFKGPGLTAFENMNKGKAERQRNEPLYKWNGEQAWGGDGETMYYSNASGDKSALQEKLEDRYENYSKTYNQTWNTIGSTSEQVAAMMRGEDPNSIEKLKTLTNTLYGSNAGGGLVGKVYTSDVDGAYAKNPGNSDFRQVYGDLQNYMQTHKKEDGSFALFAGKLSDDPDNDVSDWLSKGVDDQAVQLLQQLRSDIGNAGSWKSNQGARPRALMDIRFNVGGSNFDAITFRVDGGYIKGLKESASKELTAEESAAESSSSSLSDAREYTLMVPSGTFNNEFMTQLKRGDIYKDYLRSVGPININYNDVTRQRFSGNAMLRYDQPTGKYVASGQINMIDPATGNIIADPNGIISTALGDNDNVGLWKQRTEDILDVRNQQLINDIRLYNQYNKSK
jgi:hypothetical protein